MSFQTIAERVVLLFASGISGSIAGLYLNKKNIVGKINIAMYLFSGMASCVFLAPAIAKYFGMDSIEEFIAIGFLTACLWQMVVYKISNKIKSVMGER